MKSTHFSLSAYLPSSAHPSLPTNRYLAVLIFCGCLLVGCDSHVEQPTKVDKPAVKVIKLDHFHNTIAHQFSGKLKSAATADIAFRVPGLIQKLLVQSGDSVVKGQVVAKLDPHDYQVSIREIKARLVEAKAQHELARIERKRVQKAVRDDAISSVSLDRANSAFQRSNAKVEVIKQNLQRAEDALAYTELKAPFSGVVAQTNFETFEQVLSGVPVMTIHKLNQLEVEINVPENMIANFALDQRATLSWYKAPQVLTAQLIKMESIPNPIKQTYAVSYKVNLDSASKVKLLPGKSVSVSASFTNDTSLYCVPYSAVLGQGEHHFVYKIASNDTDDQKKVIRVNVEVDELQADNLCIKGELNPQDSIVVAGGQYLKSGDLVGDVLLRNREGAAQ